MSHQSPRTAAVASKIARAAALASALFLALCSAANALECAAKITSIERQLMRAEIASKPNAALIAYHNERLAGLERACEGGQISAEALQAIEFAAKIRLERARLAADEAKLAADYKRLAEQKARLDARAKKLKKRAEALAVYDEVQ